MNIVTEDFVSFETARLLKEKGFNEKVICYYDDGGSLNLNKFVRIFGDNGWEYPFVEHLKFNNQDEFKKFVSNFVTYNDIRTWIDEKNCILWYEP